MNRVYRLVWNEITRTWVAVSEIARGRGKRNGTALLAAVVLAIPALAADLPTGGSIVAGSGSIAQSGNTLTVTQGSDKLIAHWQNFDIGASAAVNFVQPGKTAVALNRVLGSDASRIFGTLTANGRVFLVNPNGVLFGQGAQVDVGGLVASTLEIKDSDFLSGNYVFSGTGGSVTNLGTLRAAEGGAIALLGGKVSNSGVIEARLGSVALAAGGQVTLDFAGDGLLTAKVDQAALDALVENHGAIHASGGSVLLTADAGEALLQTVVNHTGLIEARTLENREGKIVLLGGFDGGTVNVGGTLDASAPDGGNGGFIETSGAHVQIAEGAVITAGASQGKGGQWLIDPYDLTVDLAAATSISSTLGGGTGVTLQTTASGTSGPGTQNAAGNGDIFINSAITWNANSTLTLDAYRSVEVNAPITATGSSAGLTVLTNNGGSGGDFYVNSTVNLPVTGNLSINGQSYTLIDSLASLSNLSGRYALVKDIAANVTAPLGNLTGTLEGLGHTVGIDIDSSAQYVGLFGQILGGGTVRNLGLSGSVRGDVAGMLAGANAGSIVNVRASGSAVGRYGTALGGLVGQNTGSIHRGSAEVNVTGSVDTGRVGGLVGLNNGGSISDSHATGTVTGNRSDGNTGGLVGVNGTSSGGSITRSYATGAVTNLGVGAAVGGLVGISNGGSISHAYATGAVTGNSSGSAVQAKAGGLVGALHGGSLNEVWASGAVSAQHAGGLVGWSISGPTVNAAHWDTQTTGRSNEIGYGSFYVATNVSGLSTAQSFDLSNYTGFTAAEWITVGGQTRPFLASEFSYAIGNVHQLQLMASNLTGSYTLVRDIDASETGAFATHASGMWRQAGFVPVGNDPGLSSNSSLHFRGTLDGQYHVIRDLNIDMNTVVSNGTAGLFGSLGSSGKVLRVGLVDPVVKLTGTTNSGYYQAGALAGENRGLIQESFALNADIRASSVASSTQAYAGGLVGWNESGTVTQSYATGTAAAAGQSYSTAGGLVGRNNQSGATLSQSWAAVTATATTGGTEAGGLVGMHVNGTISNSIWDTSLMAVGIGASGVGGVTGLNATQMTDLSNFTAWGSDISANGGESTVWRIYDGHTAPLLRGFLKPLAVSATPDYNGSGTALTNIASVTLSGVPAGDTHVLGTATVTPGDTLTLSSPAAGSYTATSNATVSGLYSDQQGYDITYTASRNIATSGSAAGDIRLPNTITWTSGTLVIDTAGSVTTGTSGVNTTTISGDAFRLVNGNWQQNSVSLAGFTVSDFQFAGGTFLRAVGGDGSDDDNAYRLTDIYGLQGMASSALLGKHFALANDIDASGTANWNGGAGFVPVGAEFANFTGSFDGRNHVIGNLSIDRTGTERIGLFGSTLNATLRNVGLRDVSVAGRSFVGGLVGFAQNTTIRDSFVAGGQVSADSLGVGGLAGATVSGGLIDGSYASVDVEAKGNGYTDSRAGGLVGASNGTISNSYATGKVTGSAATLGDRKWIGGLVGIQTAGNISNSYATGTVSGNNTLGGLIGYRQGGTDSGNNFYATTDANGNPINTGAAFNAIGTGRTLAQLRQLATYTAAGWTDIDDAGGSGKVWRIYENATTPLLRSFLSAFTVTADSGSKTYDGSTAGLGVSYSATPDGSLLLGTASSTLDDKNAGTRTARVGGLHSSQQGYDILYVDGTVEVEKAVLTVSGTSATGRDYDGTMTAAITVGALSGFVGSETVTATASGSFDDKNAGARTATAQYTLADGTNGGLAGNYTLADTSGHTAAITPKTLNVSGTTAADKTYDGTTSAAITVGTLSGFVGSETVMATASGTFDEKNAGSRVATAQYTLADGTNGGLASNYALADTSGHAATITPKALSISGTTAADKVYDGTAAAAITVGTLSGFVGSETVTATASGTFDEKNAGSRVATAQYTLADGTNGGLATNYALADTSGHAATITPKALSVSGTTAADKVYDGTTTAAITVGTLTGFVGTETVTATASGTFDEKNAGNRIATAQYTLADGANGGLASNYALADTTGHAATVEQRPVSVDTVEVADKLWDGDRSASIAGMTLAGVLADDATAVSVSGRAAFANADIGADKPVSISDLVLSGAAAANYLLSSTSASATADIVSRLAGLDDVAPAYRDVLSAFPVRESAQNQGMAVAGPPPYTIVGSGIRLPEGN